MPFITNNYLFRLTSLLLCKKRLMYCDVSAFFKTTSAVLFFILGDFVMMMNETALWVAVDQKFS